MDLQTDESGTDRLIRAVAHIAGLTLHEDDGELAGTISKRPGFCIVPCRKASEVFAAAEAGNCGMLDTDAWTLGVASVGDGTYLCTSDGWGEWIASSIDAARAWLTATLPPGVLTVSQS